jgi:hypothetical protein
VELYRDCYRRMGRRESYCLTRSLKRTVGLNILQGARTNTSLFQNMEIFWDALLTAKRTMHARISQQFPKKSA